MSRWCPGSRPPHPDPLLQTRGRTGGGDTLTRLESKPVSGLRRAGRDGSARPRSARIAGFLPGFESWSRSFLREDSLTWLTLSAICSLGRPLQVQGSQALGKKGLLGSSLAQRRPESPQMKSMLGIPVLYETVVEHSSLRGVSDAEGAEATCCVSLKGDVDDVWCHAFHQFGVDSNGFFHLDPTEGTRDLPLSNRG